jgi:hypothetical protein
MPHIPRSLAPSGLVNPDTVPRAPLRSTADKPPLPYMGSGKSEANPLDKVFGKKKMIGRINMEDWDVDPLKIYKNLTGKELAVDEHSRLVSDAG